MFKILDDLYWKAFKDGQRNDGFCDNYKDVEKAHTQLLQAFRASVLSEGEMEEVCKESLNDALYYLGSTGNRLNEYDRKVIINYVSKALHKASFDNITKGEGEV